MKKHNWIKLTLAAGAAAGTAMGIISRLQKREQEEEPAVPAGPGSLITAQARAQLTERIGSRLPPEATAPETTPMPTEDIIRPTEVPKTEVE